MDAGHFLCDYIFYCSLAESKRVAGKQEKDKALKSMVKRGKGVTVIGKKEKGVEKGAAKGSGLVKFSAQLKL